MGKLTLEESEVDRVTWINREHFYRYGILPQFEHCQNCNVATSCYESGAGPIFKDGNCFLGPVLPNEED